MATTTRSAAARLLALPDYRRLWLVGLLANTARWLELLAGALVTFELTGSAATVAWVTAARMLPMLLFGSLVGAVADALDRRQVLLAGLAVAAGNATLVVGLAATGSLDVPILALLSFLSGTVWAGEMATRRRMIAETAPAAEIGPAVALDSVTNSANRMLGPLLGGVLFDLAGAGAAFAASALLLWIGVGLVQGHHHEQVTRPLRLGAVAADLAAGLAAARANPAVRTVLLVTVCMNMFGFSYTALIAPFGQVELGLTPALVGILAAAEPAGAIVGGLALALGVVRPDPLRAFVGGVLAFLAGILMAALAGSFALALLVLFIGGLGIAGFTNTQTSLVITEAPPGMRSRLLGMVTVCIGTGPLGVLVAGALAARIGSADALALMAAIGLIGTLLAAAAGRRG